MNGGRAAAGFRGAAGDCVTRAIAIATGLPYRQVYEEVGERNRAFALVVKRRAPLAYFKHWRRTSARDGSHKKAYAPYLAALGLEQGRESGTVPGWFAPEAKTGISNG